MQLDEALSKIQWYEQQLSVHSRQGPQAGGEDDCDHVASETKDDAENGGSYGLAQQDSAVLSSPPGRDGLPLRRVRISAGRREQTNHVDAVSACDPQAAPFSPSSMPLTMAGAQHSTAATSSSLRPRSASRSLTPEATSPPPEVPSVASFGRGPLVETAGPAERLSTGDSQAGVSSGGAQHQHGSGVGEHSGTRRQALSDVGNRARQRDMAPKPDGVSESGAAKASVQPAASVSVGGGTTGDASLDAWDRGEGALGGGQRGRATQASAGSTDTVGAHTVSEGGAHGWVGGQRVSRSAEVRRSSDSARQSVGGGEPSQGGMAWGPGVPACSRRDDSARTSVSGMSRVADSCGGLAAGLQRELRHERMRNEALLFALQQAQGGGEGSAGMLRRSGAGGAPAAHTQTAEVGCQMVCNNVFGLDAVIQCNLGEEGLAGVAEQGGDARGLPRSMSDGLRERGCAAPPACGLARGEMITPAMSMLITGDCRCCGGVSPACKAGSGARPFRVVLEIACVLGFAHCCRPSCSAFGNGAS